ncbi:hypothetical protein QMG72_00340 [Pseudarthrobacter sp. PH31-O2]|nr:hypothetical protein [Pseudarthrobacter sp. PH31-O2]
MAALLLLLPTARTVSHRILYGGLIAVGFIPLSWWLPQRILGTDHGTLLLAVVSAFLAWWIVSGKSYARRAQRLLPRVQVIDFVPFLAATLSALSLGTMLAIRSPLDALSLMTSRWDYQSHFSIYYMIRSHGEVIPTIPTGTDGAAWGFGEYPQGFHALLATLSNVVQPSITSLDAELVSFVTLQAAACVMTLLIVVAGLCALPSVRRRPAVMAPGIALASAAWIYGPGSIPVYEGFGNFYMACGMATATVLTLLTFRRRVPAIGVAVVGAGLVSICNNWLLLVSLVVVIVATKLWAIVRFRRSYNRSWWTLAGGSVTLTILGIVLPLIQISPLLVQSQHILEAQGGIAFPDFGLALLTVALAVALGFANRSAGYRISSPQLRAERLDVSRASMGLFVPIGVGLWLAVSQSIQNGAISYYFYKYLIAILLLAWPMVVAATAALLPPPQRQEHAVGNRGFISALCVLSIAATQGFGFSLPDLKAIGLPSSARPLAEMARQEARIESTPPYVARMLKSANQPQPASTVYIPAPNTIDPILAARWQWGMRGNSTSTTTALSWPLAGIAKDYNRAPALVAQMLTDNPRMSALVDPEIYSSVREHLVPLGLDPRLILLQP